MQLSTHSSTSLKIYIFLSPILGTLISRGRLSLVILLALSAFPICFCFQYFVACNVVFNALSGAAIISLSVCVFRFPLDSHRKVSTFQISCPSAFQISCSFITLLPHFFIKNFAFVPFLCQCFHLFGCNCSATVSPNLIVEFVFEWFACVDSNKIY